MPAVVGGAAPDLSLRALPAGAGWAPSRPGGLQRPGAAAAAKHSGRAASSPDPRRGRPRFGGRGRPLDSRARSSPASPRTRWHGRPGGWRGRDAARGKVATRPAGALGGGARGAPRPACSAQPCVVMRQVHGVRHPAPRPLPSTCQCRALPSRLLEPHDWAAVGGEVASTLPGAVSSLRSAVGRGPQVALPSRLDPDHKLPSHTGGPWPLGRARASRPRASAPGPSPGSMHHRAPVRGPGRGPVLGGWTGTLWTSLRGPLTAKVVCVRSRSRSRRRGCWEGPSARREIQPWEQEQAGRLGQRGGLPGRASCRAVMGKTPVSINNS